MGMYDNYNNIDINYIPDNRFGFICLNKGYKDTIIPGATCSNVFKIPADYENDVKEITIFYKQGLNIIFTLSKDDVKFKKYVNNFSFLTVKLTPEYTSLFNWYNNDACTQIKITLNDGSIIYSIVYKLKIIKALDNITAQE